MKKIITPLVLSLVLIITGAKAQEGPYLNVYGSYGMPSGSMTDFTADGVEGNADTLTAQISGAFDYFDLDVKASTVNDEVVVNSTATTVKINLGKGLNFGVAFGYMFNDHVGAELGLGYLLGSKNKFTQTINDEIDPDNIANYTLNGEISANQFRINPSLVVSTDFKDFVPYAKFGVVLGVGTKITETYSDKKFTGADNVEQVFESTGGLAFGVSAVLGAVYQFNKKTGLFLEFASTTMSYAPKQRELTEYTVGGDSYMNNLTPYQTSAKLTEYVDSIDENNIDPVDPTASTLALKLKYPFSTFAFNLGLRFSF